MLANRLFTAAAFFVLGVQAQPAGSRNVIFVMTDGARWQDVFRGADPVLMRKEAGVESVDLLKSRYWRETPAARREALMPFLWKVVAKQGQIFGNRDLGSEAFVTNGLNFSYPGYSEIFCGFPDSRINSNDKNYNPNVSVLEWLNAKPAFRGRVAAFGAWDTFPHILNAPRAGIMVNAGYDPLAEPATPTIALLNRLKQETAMWDGEPFDPFPFQSAVEYLKAKHPRVLFVGLGETDEWAHGGRYDLYLESLHRADDYARQLWDAVQAMPEYSGTTSLIFAVDHGRGEAPVEWKSHGEKVPDSKYVWMAFMGPATPASGERAHVPAITQSQVAATLAAMLGEDYAGAVAKAGQPVAGAVTRR